MTELVEKLKVGIVEDELIIAAKLESALKIIGYEPLEPACNFKQAMDLLESNKVDLFLIDINLNNTKSGIDFAKQVRKTSDCPIIFVTGYSDPQTIESTVVVDPDAFLLKPVSKEQLLATIKIAINKNQKRTKITLEEKPTTITIKDGYSYTHLDLNNITYVKSDRNYVTYHMISGKKKMERTTLTEVDNRLNPYGFIKINRSCIINSNQISKVTTNEVFLQDFKVRVSKSVRDQILKIMGS